MLFDELPGRAEWENALLSALSSPEPLKVMAACSEGLLKNPICVMGPDFHMLVPPSDQVEEYLSHYGSILDSAGYLPLQTVNYFKQDPYYSSINEKRGAFNYHSELLPFECLCVNLFRDNEFVARIVVFEMNGKFRPIDEKLLERLARYMEPCFSFSGIQFAPDLRGLPGALISLLEGMGERSLTEATLAPMGWSSEDRFMWIHLLQTEHDINNRTARYTCIQIEKKFPQTCAVQWSGGISALTNLSAAQKTPDEFLEGFEEFSKICCFRTGVSNAFAGVEQLAAYHRQAVIAAGTGKERAPDAWLYRFQDYAVYHLLQNGFGGLPVMLCCHPAVRLLSAYDAENKTEYVKTLRCFLGNQMNIIETARELFIHRSTMIYRLGRIKELTGIDWKDEELVFYLILSLKMLSL